MRRSTKRFSKRSAKKLTTVNKSNSVSHYLMNLKPILPMSIIHNIMNISDKHIKLQKLMNEFKVINDKSFIYYNKLANKILDKCKNKNIDEMYFRYEYITGNKIEISYMYRDLTTKKTITLISKVKPNVVIYYICVFAYLIPYFKNVKDIVVALDQPYIKLDMFKFPPKTKCNFEIYDSIFYRIDNKHNIISTIPSNFSKKVKII